MRKDAVRKRKERAFKEMTLENNPNLINLQLQTRKHLIEGN